MSQNFNCHGYIGQDPELRAFPDGTAVVNFSVASSNRWKDKQTGEQKERTDWLRMVATGRRAEVIAEHFKKGSEIIITKSQFRQREYEKDGKKHYSSEFMVESFDFCGKKSGDGGAAKTQAQANEYAQGQNQPNYNDFNDDIPY